MDDIQVSPKRVWTESTATKKLSLKPDLRDCLHEEGWISTQWLNNEILRTGKSILELLTSVQVSTVTKISKFFWIPERKSHTQPDLVG